MSISERRRPQLEPGVTPIKILRFFAVFLHYFLDQESLVIRLIYHNISASDGYFSKAISANISCM